VPKKQNEAERVPSLVVPCPAGLALLTPTENRPAAEDCADSKLTHSISKSSVHFVAFAYAFDLETELKAGFVRQVGL
jgi:hypothetical protein